jgi:ABC-type phosphate/phosphonate transport system substrate-binding protein
MWLLLLGLLLPAGVQAQDSNVYNVGSVKSLFRDVAEDKTDELTMQFEKLMVKHTGLKGKVFTSADAFDLAVQLDKGKIDLGLLHGFEFAWVQDKYPKLKPLMIAVNQKPYFTVHLVVAAKGKIAEFKDLKDKEISLPMRSREHCHLYLERQCQKAGSTPEKFFSKINRPESIEDGLDDVIRGKVAAAIVDDLSLDSYFIVKEGTKPFLKTIDKTLPFPANVVIFRQGGLSQDILVTFRKGMLKANKDAESRGLLSLWKLTGFEPLPKNFQQALDNIRKAYPAPAAS